jgi:hypothetical protein
MSGVPTVEPAEGWSGPDSTAEPVHEMIPSPKPGQPWLLGAAVCAAAAASAFVIVFAVTGPPPEVVTGAPVPISAAVRNPLAGSTSGRTFTRVAQRCALLKPATVARYLPGTTCRPTSVPIQNGVGNVALWNTRQPTFAGGYVSANIEADLSSVSRLVFESEKAGVVTSFTGLTVKDSRPVTGLGDAAYLVYGTYPQSSRAYLLVVDGNAGITIDYSGSLALGPIPEEEAEAAVLAMAHDVLNSLG